jgi:hypothetical protein
VCNFDEDCLKNLKLFEKSESKYHSANSESIFSLLFYESTLNNTLQYKYHVRYDLDLGDGLGTIKIKIFNSYVHLCNKPFAEFCLFIKNLPISFAINKPKRKYIVFSSKTERFFP